MLNEFANFSIFRNIIIYSIHIFYMMKEIISGYLFTYTFETRSFYVRTKSAYVATYYHYHRARCIRVIRSELRYARHVPLYRVSCHVFHASS